MLIRTAESKDLQEILNIYNDAVVNTVATFDTELRTLEKQLVWLEQHGPSYPAIVAIIDEKVVGYASLSRWNEKAAYDKTAEVSLYIHNNYHGKGIGKKLLKAILSEGEMAGIHTVISLITEGNEASIHLHKKENFHHVGVLKEVGNKFERLLDVHIFQKML